MNQVTTEKTYPIRNIWLFKNIFEVFILFPIVFLIYFLNTRSNISFEILVKGFFFSLFLLILVYFIPFIINLLKKKNFHYSIENYSIIFRQGIISKEYREIIYSNIKIILLNQTPIDKIFGLASLTIEDFYDSEKNNMDSNGYIGIGKGRQEGIGFTENKVHIPGLKQKEAEILKNILLKKIKDNPVEYNNSAL